MGKKIKLSASKIKTLDNCSWLYHSKYILKVPDISNDGASRGTIVHLIFEVLIKPRHRKYSTKLQEGARGSSRADPLVEALPALGVAHVGRPDDEKHPVAWSHRAALDGLQTDGSETSDGPVEHPDKSRRAPECEQEADQRTQVQDVVPIWRWSPGGSAQSTNPVLW